MLTTLETEKKALSALNGSTLAQSHESADQVYCATHGLVKAVWGYCAECFDEGYRDWDATRVAKSLIPAWTGIEPDGRHVIVAPVRDALDAVQTISRYKHSDALVLIIWDKLVTALDKGQIGPSWVQDADEVECVRCSQPFRPLMGDERVCESCWLAENGPRW